jgi:dGTPase
VSDATAAALRELAPTSPDDVRASRPIVRFGDDMARQAPPLKKFLRDQLYRHPQVDEMTARARQVVRELFGAYLDDPSQLRGGGAADVPTGRPRSTGREVADYIAGMTDRFAIREHERLTGRRLFA